MNRDSKDELTYFKSDYLLSSSVPLPPMSSEKLKKAFEKLKKSLDGQQLTMISTPRIDGDLLRRLSEPPKLQPYQHKVWDWPSQAQNFFDSANEKDLDEFVTLLVNGPPERLERFQRQLAAAKVVQQIFEETP